MFCIVFNLCVRFDSVKSPAVTMCGWLGYIQEIVIITLASDSSKTIEVIVTKLGTVTASDMRMHHVLMALTLAFIQGHRDLNNEKSKCSIISETFQAMPIRFAVKIIRLKDYTIIFFS